ncbi:MAG: PBP1A family penicillin-binding protein [Candidatus Pelagibacter sp. TMED263]|nr:MAG: PBP1A family penicillin-binding protein [Candidatus Pelagibacter sp. TMED263]
MKLLIIQMRYLLYGLLGFAIFFSAFLIFFISQLPDDSLLKNYKPDVMTRIHASNGELVKEYSKEYRIFVPIDNIPENLKNAFISAEDKNFYNHYGIDPVGILRAFLKNTYYIFSNKRPEGASTITQQVAKNFLLSNELSISRKVKEALLAIKIDAALSKSRILELYLNQIYLGSGTYGVAAASNRYFNKSLEELDLSEVSFLAALPKAPSRYNPKRNYEKSFSRRNWVLKRMYVNNHITKNEYDVFVKNPIKITSNKNKPIYSSDYYLEEIRKQIINIYDEDFLYGGGLSVRSSLNTSVQKIADISLKSGLLDYDKRNGYRGVIANNSKKNWFQEYVGIEQPHNFLIAKILKLEEKKGKVAIEVLQDENIFQGYLSNFNWARKSLGKGYLGPKIEKGSEIFKVNDIVHVSRSNDNSFHLEQIPKINGAIVAMDPHTGRVFALSGGFDFNESNFNRVYQAKRQPGSSFKPFVYMSALENGLQPNSLILDAPFVLDQGKALGKWKPENYGKKFYGPSTLRKGIENSRNLMTIRIAQYLGMDHITEMAERTNIMSNMPPVLSMALGAGETSLIKLTSAYASLANGGKKVEASLIDRIQDRRGENIYILDHAICENCNQPYIEENPKPKIINKSEIIFDEINAYQMVSILKGAVERGTGRKTKIEGIEIAGKTGTTNNNTDAWFLGFTSDIIVGVYTGFDIPESLGKRETGSSVAVPIFKNFIKNYYENTKALPFIIPAGVELIKIDYETGQISNKIKDAKTIYEAFGKNDNLSNLKETLVGSEGFQIIEIENSEENEFLIY